MVDTPEGWSATPPDTTLPKIKQRESGGKNLPPQANYDYPHSHASGEYQYQPQTWKDMTREFGVGQKYSEAYQAPKDVQDYIAYKTDQKYGPNSSYTWKASAPPGGYPEPHKPKTIDMPAGWSATKPKAVEMPAGWSASPPLHDRAAAPGEPWRVPKANEGQIVHAKRGLAEQGPAMQDAPGYMRQLVESMPKTREEWLSPDSAARVLGGITEVGEQAVHDALEKAGVPERLIRDTIQYATEFAPMQGGLGPMGFKPPEVAPGEASKNLPVDNSAFTPEEIKARFNAAQQPGAGRAPERPPVKGASTNATFQLPTKKIAGEPANAPTDPRAAVAGPKAVEDALAPLPQSAGASSTALPRSALTELLPWSRDNINQTRDFADKAGLTPKIEEMSARRFTARQVGKALHIDPKMVTEVRASLGIPSMDMKTDFEAWLTNRGKPSPSSPPPQSAGAAKGAAAAGSPQSVGAAKTPLSQIVEHNIRVFNEDNKNTVGFKEQLRAATNTIKAMVAPETIRDTLTGAETGRQGAAIIRRRQGQADRMALQASRAMDKFAKFTNSLNMDEQLTLIQWMQSSTTGSLNINLPTEARQFAEAFRAWMIAYEKKLKSLPDLEQMEFRENFVHQGWKQPDKAKQFLFGPGRMGSSGFTKKHVFDDYRDGIIHGEVPETTDPMEIFKRYVENASQFIAGKEILNDAKEADIVRQLPMSAAPPEGWQPINGRSHPGTQLYAPEGFAQVFNNYVSQIPKGGWGNALKAAQFAGNKATALKLFWAGFHATLETGVSWGSSLANVITKGAHGDILGAGAEAVKTPFKPVTSIFAARKAWKVYLDTTGEFGTPEMRRIVQGGVNANFDFLREGKAADEYRASRLGGFFKSLERGRLKVEARNAFAHIKQKPISGAVSEIYDVGMRSVATAMEPVFQYYVPMIKTQAFVDSARTALRARPEMTAEEFDAECVKIADNIDGRFGEVNRSNIFWSQTQKAMAQSAFLSYSYVYGLAKNALGAGFDVAKLPSRAVMKARGMSKEMIWTDRMSWAIALPVVYVLKNAIYQYLMTGNAPNTIDMSKPKTGGTNEGQPERAVIPDHMNSYINFFRHPLTDLYDKFNPLIQVIGDLALDMNYRDKQIYDMQDPMKQRIQDGMTFAGEELGSPVVFEREADKKPGTNIGLGQTLAGVGAAGMADTNPNAFKQMMNYKDSEAKFDSEWAKYQDKWVAAGHARYSLPHKKKQAMIQSIMQGKDPMVEFNKLLYGGTQ